MSLWCWEAWWFSGPGAGGLQRLQGRTQNPGPVPATAARAAPGIGHLPGDGDRVTP